MVSIWVPCAHEVLTDGCNRYCWNGTEEDEMVEDFITGADASVGILYRRSRIVA
jgi:hypothetical protein